MTSFRDSCLLRAVTAVTAAAAAGVLAVAGCTAHPRDTAPGQPGAAAVRAACRHPGAALGAAQLQRACQRRRCSPAGITGAGTVIAVVVPYAAADLAVYSRRYGLPVPRVRELSYGRRARSSGRGAARWVQEATMDLEMAHTLAARAALIYLAAPTGAAGQAGAAYDQALAWPVTHERVDVVPYSAGIPEAWAQPARYRPILGSRAGLQAAARAGVTVVASPLAGQRKLARQPGPCGSAWPSTRKGHP